MPDMGIRLCVKCGQARCRTGYCSGCGRDMVQFCSPAAVGPDWVMKGRVPDEWCQFSVTLDMYL